MKKCIPALMILLLVSAVPVMGQKSKKKNKGKGQVKLETFDQKFSYSIGMDIAQNLKQQGLTVDAEMLYLGLTHGISNDTTQMLLTRTQVMEVFQEFQKKQQEAMLKKSEEESQKYTASGAAYLDSLMKVNPNLKKTASGLVYEVVTEGNGANPTLANTVKVNYTGFTPDGTIFDSTEGRGPATFPLNGLIPGWQEGIQLMRPGSKFRFYIPANLGYGNNPPPNTPIKAGMTLVFDVELLGIEK